MKDNSKRKERNVEKSSPKTGKNRDQPARVCAFSCNFSHVGGQFLPCAMHRVDARRQRVRIPLCWQESARMRLKAELKHRCGAELVSEFRKYSQGGERNEPKFATLRAKCGEIRSEKFGRFVSERTVGSTCTSIYADLFDRFANCKY